MVQGLVARALPLRCEDNRAYWRVAGQHPTKEILLDEQCWKKTHHWRMGVLPPIKQDGELEPVIGVNSSHTAL